jgi:hypothetical protein
MEGEPIEPSPEPNPATARCLELEMALSRTPMPPKEQRRLCFAAAKDYQRSNASDEDADDEGDDDDKDDDDAMDYDNAVSDELTTTQTAEELDEEEEYYDMENVLADDADDANGVGAVNELEMNAVNEEIGNDVDGDGEMGSSERTLDRGIAEEWQEASDEDAERKEDSSSDNDSVIERAEDAGIISRTWSWLFPQ